PLTSPIELWAATTPRRPAVAVLSVAVVIMSDTLELFDHYATLYCNQASPGGQVRHCKIVLNRRI
ncbi:hypothetical protein OFB94_27925, partial [Escherichia coli]|nr:hypothetical protein [Escherichia coli]